jgi:hypothetical protein
VPSRNPLPLREVLICEVWRPNLLVYALVLRKGSSFKLLGLVKGDHCALMTHENTLLLLERRFELPVQVVSGTEGAFLGAQTLLAHRNGQPYSLK